MIEVSMGHKDILDIGKISAGGLDVLDQLLGEGTVKGINENAALIGFNQPCRHPADADIVYIVERFPRLDFLCRWRVEPLA